MSIWDKDGTKPAAEQRRKPAKKTTRVTPEEVAQVNGKVHELEHKSIIAEDLIEASANVIGKIVTAVDALSDKNEFLKWVRSRNPDNYRAQAAMLRRIQKWRRESFLVDAIELFQLYLKEKALG